MRTPNPTQQVAIQNQSGRRPTKWDRTGTIVEKRGFDKYVVRVDGSGRPTVRNRRFLKELFQDEGMFGTPLPTHTRKPAVRKTAEDEAVENISPANTTTQASPTTISEQVTSPGSTQSPTQRSTHELPLPCVPQSSSDGSVQSDVQPVYATPVRPSTASLPVSPAMSNHPLPEIESVRRPPRIRKQKLVYDPDSGAYVARNPDGRNKQS